MPWHSCHHLTPCCPLARAGRLQPVPAAGATGCCQSGTAAGRPGYASQLYERASGLLTTTTTTFSSSLAVLTDLAAALPLPKRALQAPRGLTPLGLAAWLYIQACADLLRRSAIHVTQTERLLRQQLGVHRQQFAAAAFQLRSSLCLGENRGERLLRHFLQRYRQDKGTGESPFPMLQG